MNEKSPKFNNDSKFDIFNNEATKLNEKLD